MKQYLRILLFIIFSISAANINGQTWRTDYPDFHGFLFGDVRSRIIETSNGNYLFAPIQSKPTFQLNIITLNKFGKEISIWNYPNIPWISPGYIRQLPDLGFLAAGVIMKSSKQAIQIFRTNDQGDSLSMSEYSKPNSNLNLTDFIQLSDGNFLLIGYTDCCSPYVNRFIHGFMMKIDVDGNVLWEKEYNPLTYPAVLFSLKSVVELEGGDLLVGGYYNTNSLDTNGSGWSANLGGLLMKTNKDGEIKWVKELADKIRINRLVKLSDSTFGFTSYYSINVMDTSGNVVNSIQKIDIYEMQIIPGKQGGFWVSKSDSLIKFDSEGQEVFGYKYHASLLLDMLAVDNGILMVGSIPTGQIKGTSIFKIGENGLLHNHVISGKVFHDKFGDCIDTNGVNIVNANLMLKGTDYSSYTTTDSTGQYFFRADTGKYSIEIKGLGNYWNVSNCGAPLENLYVQDTLDTLKLSIPMMAPDCPSLKISIGNTLFRRCTYRSLTMSYKNNGANVDSVYVQLHLPKEFSLESSSHNYVVLDSNFYKFELGSLGILESGTIDLRFFIQCDANFGTPVCLKAKIFPHGQCIVPDSTWDKSSISVDGICVDDSLSCFIIKNTGTIGEGDMQGPTTWRMFENDQLFATDTFRIGGQDSLSLCLGTTAENISIQVDQRPGHPGKSKPNASLNFCSAQTNFAFNQPLDDLDEWVDISCGVIIGSNDPNQKLVEPIGFGDQKYIAQNQNLEYHIDFQNTGNDTAFVVRILDSLDSKFLNVLSFSPGASSHPYTYTIFEDGILEFTFKNILLPDSNVNEEKSHGFVQFEIEQKPDNPIGTVINNQVGIYFDFNEPVITNKVYNTVHDTTLQSSSTLPNFCFIGKPIVTLSVQDTSLCIGDSIQVVASGGTNYSWTPNSNIDDNTTSFPLIFPSETITYTVNVQDSHYCFTAVDSIKFSMLESPIYSITALGNNLEINTLQNDLSFQWLDCDDSFAYIPGEKDSFFTPSSSGNYAVEVSNNICNEISACFFIALTQIEQDNLSPALNFSVYPNPTSGNFTVAGTWENIEIYDYLGALVSKMTPQNLNIQQMKPGIYFLKINGKSDYSFSKLIISND